MSLNKLRTHKNKLAAFILVAFHNLSDKSYSLCSFKNILKLLTYSLSQLRRLAHLLGLSFTAFCAQDLSANDPVQFKPTTSIQQYYSTNQHLLTTDPTDGKIYLIKNNYNLHFTKSLVYDANIGTDLLASATNLTKSSNPDFIALDKDSGNFTLFRNEGSDNFSIQGLHNVGSPINDAFVADMDGDGDDDIVYSTPSGIGWIETENSQNFIPHANLANGLQNISALEVADFDDDGDQDIFFADSSLNGVGFIKNEGSDNFSPVADLGSANDIQIDDLELVDLDNDGHKDLVFASGQSSILGQMSNNGSDNFMPLESLYTELSGVDMIEVDDPDGNGKVDIFAASSINDDRLILENNGSGGFIPHLNS